MPTPAAPSVHAAAATGAASISMIFRSSWKMRTAGRRDPTTACRARAAWRASTSPCLLLRKRTAELAVTVQQDLVVAFFDLAEDFHHVAAADDRRRLDDAALHQGRLEAALRPAF